MIYNARSLFDEFDCDFEECRELDVSDSLGNMFQVFGGCLSNTKV